MRKGEKSRVMVKSLWGYNHPEHGDKVEFPAGWDTEEKKNILRHRRAFFEIKLYDWIVRHDLYADGAILKTIHDKGIGFDRADSFDEIRINLRISQGENVFADLKEIEVLMTDTDIITPVTTKVLNSMKE